ncbi:MAG: patatin family protein [Clostridiales bacterium]|nr:patatin family protein [Clostridiales bacterium]
MEFTKLYDGALVLEGGGMRGSYTAGVLDFLIDIDLYFKNCYAVSAGACNCCNYLSKQKGRSYNININYAHDRRYAGLHSYITTGNYFNKEFTLQELPNRILPYDYIEYQRTKSNFYAVATNIRTGEAEYLKVENMKKDMDYIWASSSLPLISKSVKIGDEEYLDGGVTDSIPVAKALEDGNSKIVVILTRDVNYRKEPNKLLPMMKFVYRKYPKLVHAVAKRHVNYNKTLRQLRKMEKAGNVFVIRPSEEITVGRLETDSEKLKALYEQGYRDAKNSYEAMKKYLNL